MKKTLAILLTVLLLAASVGCAKTPETTTGQEGYLPDGFTLSTGLDEDGFFEGVTAKKLVTLPECIGVEMPASVMEVSQEDVDEQIAAILDNYKEYEHPDRPIEDGDTVNIDYVGESGGVEFEGGSTKGKGTTVTIGVTSYIDDFLEQLIGHKPGEQVEVEVTFPDPYENNPSLAGKDAVFHVTINYIQGDAIVPELSDAIAADYGFETAEELENDIRRWLISVQQSDFVEKLLEDVECSEIPQSVMDYVIAADLYYAEQQAAAYQVTLEELLKAYYSVDSVDAYVENGKSGYQSVAETYLVYQAVAETYGLKVTDEDIAAAGYEDEIETYGKPYLKFCLLQEKTVAAFICENAVIAAEE